MLNRYRLKPRLSLTAMAHVTCLGHSQAELREVLEELHAVAELLPVRQAAMRALLCGRLPAGRVQALQQALRAAGLPL